VWRRPLLRSPSRADAAHGPRGKTGSGVYPVAVPTYGAHFIAMEKGYFKDEGYDFKLIQGGSGLKTREILASRQGDFAIADILHVLQLNKNGRSTRALNTVDQRAPGVRFTVRKDLFDQGIDTMQKVAAWKRPDGKRAIVDFPRPRDAVALRETRQYAELFSRVWHSLGEEFAKGRSV